MNRLSINRRDFLKAGIAGSILFPVGLRGNTPSKSTGRARNVIFMVSDGMSLGSLILAERYKQMARKTGTHWLQLYAEGKPVRRALVDTCSANSLVTDSAAGASAWGCGYKVNNGSLNYTPDGKARPTLIQLAKAAGYGAGLVTTARITHATPAGFTAQLESRVDEALVADQYLEIGVDVLLGGGEKYLRPKNRADGKDVLAAFAKAGYHIVRSGEELGAADEGRLVGVFSESHIPYKIDRESSPDTLKIPSLMQMTGTAISRLSKNPRGFLLLVEGARVDHAAHANDLGALIHEQLEFDDAVGVALKFAAQRDDTLVIITTDHGNANPGLNGTGGSFDSRGGSYGDTQKCFERLKGIKKSNRWILKALSKKSSAGKIRERVKMATGITLLDDEIGLLQQALRKDSQSREGYRVRNPAPITLAQILSNYTTIGWSGTAHTADFAELGAVGPGSEMVGGLMQNTELFTVVSNALGLNK